MSTFTYIVKVASSKFTIDGGPAPKLTFRDGDTFVFDQADASNSGHTLQFSATSNNSGSSEYTTGVTKTGTAGQAGAKTTIVTSGSTTDTLYYYSSGGGTHGEEFSNTGFNTTAENLLKPIVGGDSTAEKWGPMINQSIDQIVPKSGGTFSGDLTVTGDMTVSGTTTTIDTILQSVDKLEVGANSSDYGAQINQAGTGNILQLQDNGTNVLVVEDGGAVTTTGGLVVGATLATTIQSVSEQAEGGITIVSSGHGLVYDDRVRFTTTDTLPTGLTVGTLYYVVDVDGTALQVSTSQGGTEVQYTDAGTGTHSVQNIAMDVSDGTVRGAFVGDLTGEINGLAIVTPAVYNIGLGFRALDSITTGDYNVSLGVDALTACTEGERNVGIGYEACDSLTEGDRNTGIGVGSLGLTTTGDHNTGIGAYALSRNIDGQYNTALGHGAINFVSSGSYNTGLGYNAGDNITTGSSNIMIGANVDADSATASNQLNIGNTIYGDLSTGNVGIGVTPDMLRTTDTALALGATARQFVTSSNHYVDMNNVKLDASGNPLHITTNPATRHQQLNTGVHTFDVAPSASAGAAVSFSSAMTIDNSGNVGIGTAAPALGGSANQTYLTISNADGTDSADRPAVLELSCNNKGEGVRIGQVDFWSDVDGGDDKVGSIVCAQQGTTSNNVGGKFRIQTKADGGNLTDRMVILESGDVTVNTGDLVFGTAGKGVVLGATSNTDANTLDDYEEGTWTPASSGTSPTVQLARYTKIGNVVHVSGYLTSLGSCTGTYFSGLPFPVKSNVYASARYHSNHSNYYKYVLRANGNTSNLNFLNNADAGVDITDATASFCVFYCTYETG